MMELMQMNRSYPETMPKIFWDNVFGKEQVSPFYRESGQYRLVIRECQFALRRTGESFTERNL
jgi:hypothetical protein